MEVHCGRCGTALDALKGKRTIDCDACERATRGESVTRHALVARVRVRPPGTRDGVRSSGTRLFLDGLGHLLSPRLQRVLGDLAPKSDAGGPRSATSR